MCKRYERTRKRDEREREREREGGGGMARGFASQERRSLSVIQYRAASRTSSKSYAIDRNHSSVISDIWSSSRAIRKIQERYRVVEEQDPDRKLGGRNSNGNSRPSHDDGMIIRQLLRNLDASRRRPDALSKVCGIAFARAIERSSR